MSRIRALLRALSGGMAAGGLPPEVSGSTGTLAEPPKDSRPGAK
ncbi:MAG: hypothetical protein WAS07_12130 [Micropruina sp.]